MDSGWNVSDADFYRLELSVCQRKNSELEKQIEELKDEIGRGELVISKLKTKISDNSEIVRQNFNKMIFAMEMIDPEEYEMDFGVLVEYIEETRDKVVELIEP